LRDGRNPPEDDGIGGNHRYDCGNEDVSFASKRVSHDDSPIIIGLIYAWLPGFDRNQIGIG